MDRLTVPAWALTVWRLSGDYNLVRDSLVTAGLSAFAVTTLKLGWLLLAVSSGITLALDARLGPFHVDETPVKLILRLVGYGTGLVLSIFGVVMLFGWLNP